MITQDPEQIKILRQGGKILAVVLRLVASKVVVGVSAWELDQLAEKEIRNAGASPSFKNYRARPADLQFPASLCVSINHEVVHGVPTKDKVLKQGDIVGLDLGVKFQGLYTDAAVTVAVGKVSKQAQDLIVAAKEALEDAIKMAKIGNFTGDIGFAIESAAKKYNFKVVRELVGHGVGTDIHEDPEVPCFGKPKTGIRLVDGMVLAIEPMVNAGSWEVVFAEDGWTVGTADKNLSAHMEHTILITPQGPEVLTRG